MPNKYQVTVLMRSYRSWDTLGAAIESVKAQTAFKVPGEMFCILGVVPIEDERTTRIFKKNGVDVIHTAEPDITKQSNVGFAAADSDYVFVFDSDDFIYPNTLLSLYSVASHTSAGIVYCDYEIWSPDGFEGIVQCHSEGRTLERGCYVTETCLYNRGVWEQLGGFDESLWRYAQWDYFLRVQRSGVKFVHVPFHGFRYCVGPDQLSSRLHRGELKDKDDPIWSRFKEKHGLSDAVTIGHGGRWVDWGASCPA